MTDIRVNLNKSIVSVNWANITVKSSKHEGTLEQVNCAILPKKSDCSESAWKALGCLDSAWKAFIRRIQYPKDADRHTKALNNAIHEFYGITALDSRRMPESLFRDCIISALNVHWTKSKKTGEGFSAAACATFKKNVLRMAIRMQKATFTLMNSVKNDKQEPVSLNVKNLSTEQICELLGIDMEVWERIQAAKAQKAC